ncbi:flagellar hook-length control protein FliK [Paracoccus binzhouensis]|uniref:flagellar hook-length control protein FliK n=1 Tax=Paracoccus binzhouensis TaxID=2796149 RepID=UPI0018EECB43|nr:flagellar hook-length control protein FliK [Paracoccus binzhouensis]
MEIASRQAGASMIGLQLAETGRASHTRGGEFFELLDPPPIAEAVQDGESELPLSERDDADASTEPDDGASVACIPTAATAGTDPPAAPEPKGDPGLAGEDSRLGSRASVPPKERRDAQGSPQPPGFDSALGGTVGEAPDMENRSQPRPDGGNAEDLGEAHPQAVVEAKRRPGLGAGHDVPLRDRGDPAGTEDPAVSTMLAEDFQDRLADGGERMLDAAGPDQGTVSVSVLSGRAHPADLAHGLPDRPHFRATAADAQNVLGQISDRLAEGHEDVVEITLSPEELGKVRLVISAGEKPSVAVHAERQETFDLLRRNVDALQKELREAGLLGADVSFSGGGERRERHAAATGSSANASRGPETGFLAAAAAPAARPGMGRQIDIRI